MTTPLYLHARSTVDMMDEDALDYGFTHRDRANGTLLVLRPHRRRTDQDAWSGDADTLPRAWPDEA